MVVPLLLSVQEAEISFGQKILYANLSFNIHQGDKICLVGKNGVGKSTLMNIVTGERELDGGLRWQLQGSTIGYLQQEVSFTAGQTVYDYIFAELQKNHTDGFHDYKIERVVEPLELNISDQMNNLSGGQLRRAALARALVEEPDILLLDEPTNHLDLNVIEWLEQYLRGYRGAVVCVSHDKAFLGTISDKVFWLDRGRLRVCPRGFSFFDEWSAMLLEQEERELHNRQKVLEQEVEWASRGVKARRKRNVRRLELMKAERDKLRADKNSLAKMLAKVEFAEMEVEEASSLAVVEFHQVCKSFAATDGASADKTILNKFNLRLLRGDRIGIVGKNGSGKTSFLKMLIGEMVPDSGKIKLAKSISFSYFDQKRKDLKPELTVQRNLIPGGSDYIDVMGKTRHVCGYLRDFLFDPKMAQQPVATLSGGQKNRLMLAKILANPGSLLILDEPTNDLDMDTLDMLEDILTQYTGTLLVVSHDRDFLDQTVSKILAFEGNGRVEACIGGYQDYLAMRKKQGQRDVMTEDDDVAFAPTIKPKSNPPAVTQPLPAPAIRKKAQKMPYKLQFELSKLPEKIKTLEEEIVLVNQRLAESDLYVTDSEKFQRLSLRLAAATTELADAEQRWLELSELAESFSD